MPDHYAALGVGFTVEAPKSMAAFIARLLIPFAVDESGSLRFTIEQKSQGWSVISEQSELTGLGKFEAVSYLLSDVNKAVVAGTRYPGFHAGVVARDGVVVAFPGPSGAGKSTLTSACLLEGFDYWSDEALICSYDGIAFPYPRPIALSPDSFRLLGLEVPPFEQLVRPDLFGARYGEGEGTIGALVSLARRPGPAALTTMPPSEAVRLLLDNSFNHYRWPEQTHRLVTELVGSVRRLHLAFADPRDAARLLRRDLSR